MNILTWLERKVLQVPTSVDGSAFAEQLATARHHTLSEAGPALKFTSASAIPTILCAGLIVLFSAIAITSDRFEGAGILTVAGIVAFFIALFGGAGLVLSTYWRARIIKPVYQQLYG